MSEKYKNEVNKKIGKNVIARGDEILDIPRCSTGSLSLDAETGGGFPLGRIITVSGDWSSGKTALVLKVAAEFQTRWPDKDIYWIDAEGVWDPRWAKSLGLDPQKVYLVRPEYAEQAYNIALGAIDDGAGFIVVDSVAALSAKSEMEGAMDDIQVAAMAKVNAKFMRKMVGYSDEGKVPPTLVLLNQLSTNIGAYGNPIIELGGKALQFYPSLKITLSKGEVTDGDKIYKYIGVNDEGVEVKGQKIKFYTDKNKTAPWKRRGHFWFFSDGVPHLGIKRGDIDRKDEIARMTLKYGIARQRGSIYDLVHPETKEVLQFKGMKSLKEHIMQNDSVRIWVEAAVLNAVKEDMAGNDTRPEEEREAPIQEEQLGKLRAIRDNEEEGTESSERDERDSSAG